MSNSVISPSKGSTILVIDDDSNNLALITDYLEEGSNFTILVAEDGESGVRSAVYARPDLILLDVLMPGMDGYETCRKLKAEESTRDIPVIFMTALAETENKVKGFESGAVDYITKPFKREDVLARMGVHLHIRELTGKLKETKALLERRVEERTEELAKANEELAKANRELQAEIAERRQAEHRLRESEKRFRILVENLPVKVFIKDRESSYITCSPSYALDLGIEPEEIQGKTDYDFYPEELAEKYRADDRRIMDSCRGEDMDEEYLNDGRHYWVHTIKTPLKDEAHHVTGILGVFWDITERRSLEEQLRQAVKLEAIGALAGGVAHDFNNLMTVVIGYSDLLLYRLQKDDPVHKDIEQIRNAGLSAASLTRRLLAFSSKQVLRPKVLDLNRVVANTEKMLRRLIGEDLELVSNLDPALGLVTADPGQVEQVIINLAVNARDAMPRGGKLTIETANVCLDASYARQHIDVQPGQYVMLAMSDTGMGMDPATLSHMFEPFFTTKEKGKGTGLGLATIYGIVKQSFGHIRVYSELGQGSTFKVYLPRVPKDKESVSLDACPVELPQGGSETILMVEDDDLVRSLASRCLRMNGYVVIEAHRGAEALKIFKEHEGSIDMLVTDVVMPGMSGLELTKEICSLYPELKVLYMSGYTTNAIVHHGVLDAGSAFLQKPFTPEVLARKVREVLDEPIKA